MEEDCRIERNFRVRFAQVDGARVIYYPRYLEIVADTFPEAVLDHAPYDLSIRFFDSNRLADNIRLVFESGATGWSVSGSMKHEHFSIALTKKSVNAKLTPFRSSLASFETEQFTIHDWMCGPGGDLHISRYFELISHTVEHWFESTLEMSFNELHVARNLGIPTVQLETRCRSFPRSGDTVSMALRPISVGSSAVQLRTWLIDSGEILLESKQVIVFVELNDKKISSIQIPELLRQRMSSQLAAAPSQ